MRAPTQIVSARILLFSILPQRSMENCVIKMSFRKMVQLSVLPLFLFFSASAEAKANRLLPISFVASRPQKKCSGDSKPAVWKIFLPKFTSATKTFLIKRMSSVKICVLQQIPETKADRQLLPLVPLGKSAFPRTF